MPLILASASAIRRSMLEAAGVPHEAVVSRVDEQALKTQVHGGPAEIAVELARAKALAVGASHPQEWVIGSDSIVSVDGRMFDKPATRDEAAEHLRVFSGKAMLLTSAAALARGPAVDWAYVESALLRVRALSAKFIDDYLDAEWPEVGHCVGVFRFEGRGVQLFESVEGDPFTIMGMPLIPLLGALRDRGLLAA